MVQLTRECPEYVNLSQRYLIGDTDQAEDSFQRQYFNLYRARMRLLRPRIIEAAKEAFGEDTEPCGITQAVRNEVALVIGVVQKRMQLRPSVLRDMADEQLALPEPVLNDRLVSDEDYLEIEDEEQIVRLKGNVELREVATGCVVGLRGRRLLDDVFQVEALVWPRLAPQPPLPSCCSKYVMFVSGLAFQGNQHESERLLALDVLQQWLCGELPLNGKQREVVQNTVRLVVAGESIAVTEQTQHFTTAARYLVKNEACPIVECAQLMDRFLARISSVIPVDVMPGQGDPATHLMPQQPMHRGVFPRASFHGKMLNLVTNPYHFSIQGVHLLGTSGNNINDLKRLSTHATSTALLQRTVLWQHCAPTVPDTVDGFPFSERDPLVIEHMPHVLFAGNQSHAEALQGEHCLFLSIPSFVHTKTALLLDLSNMNVVQHSFL